MHGNGQVRINIKKFFQQLIIKFRSDNVQIMDAAIHLPCLKAAGIAEIKTRWSNIIFHTFAGLRQFFKGKTERLHCILVKILMQDTQTFLSVKALGICAKICEVFNHIGFDVGKF